MSASLGLARYVMLDQEEAWEYQELHKKAFQLISTLGTPCGGVPLSQAGDWVLRNLADDEVKRKHGIPKGG